MKEEKTHGDVVHTIVQPKKHLTAVGCWFLRSLQWLMANLAPVISLLEGVYPTPTPKPVISREVRWFKYLF